MITTVNNHWFMKEQSSHSNAFSYDSETKVVFFERRLLSQDGQ